MRADYACILSALMHSNVELRAQLPAEELYEISAVRTSVPSSVLYNAGSEHRKARMLLSGWRSRTMPLINQGNCI